VNVSRRLPLPAALLAGGAVAAWLAAPAAQFRSGVNLVEVYATVTTQSGEAVTDLGPEAFVVREEGVLQVVSTFAAGDLPLAVALAVDHSWSMAGRRLDTARAAAHAFLDELQPGDELMLLAVGSDVETAAPLSADRPAQHRAIDALGPWGSTRLYDAVVTGLRRIGAASGRRALVVLSDGADRSSTATADEVVEAARRSDVLVYSVALGDAAPPLFARLAGLTGARTWHVERVEELAPAFRAIARELRRQYLLGYTPRPAPASGWRRLSVEVKRPGLAVRARAGYYAR